ncbi:MAG: phytanoyl-CoA dioxygenase family protein [Spirochaetaceae bacterium]|nr:phytanoyl-CoA dioxygenase family protein [Spirochaetaceae bacterium]
MSGVRQDEGGGVDRVLGTPQLAELREQGFYLLQRLIDEAEAGELLAETRELIDRAPAAPKGTIDAHGDPVSHPEDYHFPLDDAGEPVLNRIRYPAWRSRLFLEAYGNPRILHAAHELYGDRMVPFDESIVLKMPHHGAGFPWHQDGNFRTGPVAERGHNFGIYLTPSAVANGAVHVLPGSHRRGILDLNAMVQRHGFALPGAVAAPASPGDANIHSRSIAHGSQRNVSPDLRVTWYVGFHHRDAIRGAWDEAAIEARRLLIPIAVEARRISRRFPNEAPFPYRRLGLEPPATPADRDRALRSIALHI